MRMDVSRPAAMHLLLQALPRLQRQRSFVSPVAADYLQHTIHQLPPRRELQSSILQPALQPECVFDGWLRMMVAPRYCTTTSFVVLQAVQRPRLHPRLMARPPNIWMPLPIQQPRTITRLPPRTRMAPVALVES